MLRPPLDRAHLQIIAYEELFYDKPRKRLTLPLWIVFLSRNKNTAVVFHKFAISWLAWISIPILLTAQHPFSPDASSYPAISQNDTQWSQ